MIKRENYINQLKQFIDRPFVKVLTGVRRSGKSTILKLLYEELKLRGVSDEQILHINLESFNFSGLNSAEVLYRFVSEKIDTNIKQYLLIDEIQEVNGWEKAINSLLTDYSIDIYITGSNSRLLSSELATYLAGRYVEIPVFTLSFSEYLDFQKFYFPNHNENVYNDFMRYLRFGGFPVLHTAEYTDESAYKIVYDIYSSVILRDTVQRYNIRDVELLERVIKFAFDNIGNTFSGKSIADYFNSQQRKIDLNTVYNYLYALEGAFVLYRTHRYDIRGKEILKTQEKFYLSDVALLYATMGFKDRMIAGVLENIVFLELKRRGYHVYVGKLYSKEIDFIGERRGEKIYVQVTYKLENENVIEREFSNLLSIGDNFPKFVVSMDEFWKDTYQGIQHLHIADFLLKEF